jgi:RNA polymerase sigma factor (sigma-70 family)
VTEKTELKNIHSTMELLVCYDEELRRFAMNLSRDQDWARDIVQEGYKLVLEELEGGGDIKDPLPYIFTTIRNLAHRQRMREQFGPVKTDEDQYLAGVERLDNLVLNEPELRVGSRETIIGFLRGLKPKYRKVLRLDRVDGLSAEEIAAELHMSVHTVRQYRTKLNKWCRNAWRDR